MRPSSTTQTVVAPRKGTVTAALKSRIQARRRVKRGSGSGASGEGAAPMADSSIPPLKADRDAGVEDGARQVEDVALVVLVLVEAERLVAEGDGSGDGPRRRPGQRGTDGEAAHVG